MARFMNMLLTADEGQVGRLSPASVAEILRRQTGRHPAVAGAALGFYERLQYGQRALEHGGAFSGYCSHLLLLPEHRIGFFFAANAMQVLFDEELVRAFLQHGSTARPAASESPASIPENLEDYVGYYRFERYFPRNFERVGGFLGHAQVTREQDGLSLTYPWNAFPSSRLTWQSTDLFQDRETGSHVVFERDDSGRVTHLCQSMILSLDRVSFWEEPWLHLLFLGGFVAVFGLPVVAGLGDALLAMPRKSRGKKRREPTGTRFMLAIACLNLVFLAGMSHAVLSIDRWEFALGLPLTVRVLLFLPLVSAFLMGGLMGACCRRWRNGEGTLRGRLGMSLFLATCLLFLLFLDYWQLLGYRV
jgi:hypothetical protein